MPSMSGKYSKIISAFFPENITPLELTHLKKFVYALLAPAGNLSSSILFHSNSYP